MLRVIFYHCAAQGVPIVIDWVENTRRKSSSASGKDNIVTLFEPIKKRITKCADVHTISRFWKVYLRFRSVSETQQSSLHQLLHQLLDSHEGTHMKTFILPTTDVEEFLALFTFTLLRRGAQQRICSLRDAQGSQQAEKRHENVEEDQQECYQDTHCKDGL